MKQLLEHFLYDSREPQLIDGTGLQPDPELATRNLARVKKAIEYLGPKWVLYQHSFGDIQIDAAANQDATYAAHSHTEE